MGIIIDCTATPPITGALWRPDVCDSGPVLIQAMEVLAEYVCNLAIGASNNLAVVPPGTIQADWDTFFTGGIPETESFVVIGGQIWITDDAGVSWSLVNSPEFRYADGSTFVDANNPTPAELRALYPESSPTDHATVYNAATGVWHITDDNGVSWNANRERTYRIGQIGDFVDPNGPTPAELRTLFDDNPQEFAEVYIPSVTTRWYTDDFGVTWGAATDFAIISGTLAAIQALATAGQLSAGAYYRVNDNTHANGGDLLALAFDTEHLASSGWYFHTPRLVWFPMIWNPITGEILELTDPLYNNKCIGANTIDDFEWDVNDGLGGAWTDNLFSGCDITYNVVLTYGTLDNNTFVNGNLIFTGHINTCSSNNTLNSNFTVGNTVVGAMSTNGNRVVGGDLTVTDSFGSFINSVVEYSTVSITDNGAGFTGTNNTFINSTATVSNTSMPSLANNYINGTTLFIDTLDTLSTFSFNFIINSSLDYTNIVDSDVIGNSFFNCTGVIDSLLAADSVSGNTFYRKTFAITNGSTVNNTFISEGKHIFNDDAADVDFIIKGDTDASNFYLDASTNRVGLGTATPSQKLDVVGVVKSTGGDFDGAVVVNESGANVDMRVEGDTDANLWFADASADAIGIGTNAPTAYLHQKASTTTAATTRIPSGTAPTSPNEGDVWNDSTIKALIAFQDGIKQTLGGVIFTQTADVTVASTATETTLIGSGVGTLTLPANFFVAGKGLRLTAWGKYGTDAVAPQQVLRVKLGATTIVATASDALTAGIGNDRSWRMEVNIMCKTTGAGGTVSAQGRMEYETSGSTVKTYHMPTSADADVAVNTTTTQAITVTADWDVADADNTITLRGLIVEVVG